MLRLSGEIGEFVRIGDEIVEFLRLAGIEGADVFVPAFDEHEIPRDAALVTVLRRCGHDVAIGTELVGGEGHEHGMRPRHRGIFQQGREVVPVHVPGLIESGKGKQGRGNVGPSDRRRTDFALGQGAGHGHDQRRADVGVVGGKFGAEAVLPPGVSLIGGEDDEGVLELPARLEGGEDLADAFVERTHRLMILTHPRGQGAALIARGVVADFLAEGFARKNGLAVCPFGPGSDVLHPGRLAGARWIDIGGRGDFCARIILAMPVGRRVGGMDAAVAKPEEPRLFCVAVFSLDVVDRPAGVVVGGVAFHDPRLAAVDGEELVVVVIG